MAVNASLFRTAMYDKDGRMSREWVLFFRTLANTVTDVNTSQNIDPSATQTFDDVPQRDITRELISALLMQGETPQPVAVDVLASFGLETAPGVQSDPLALLTLIDTPCFDLAGAAAAVQAGSLQSVNNLSDLASAATARTNLGLGTAAVQNTTAFDASGAATAAQAAAIAASCQRASNLSDVVSRATAISNLVGSWVSYTPTLTSNGLTISGVSITDAQYLLLGSVLHLKVNISFTVGGTLSTNINVSLPFAVAGGLSAAPAYITEGGAGIWLGALGYANGSNLVVSPFNGANWAAGTATILASATYRVV